MMKKSISDHVWDILVEWDLDGVCYGDVHILDECAGRAGLLHLHPLDRHERILNALDKSSKWEKFLFRGHIVNRKGITCARLLRSFEPVGYKR